MSVSFSSLASAALRLVLCLLMLAASGQTAAAAQPDPTTGLTRSDWNYILRALQADGSAPLARLPASILAEPDYLPGDPWVEYGRLNPSDVQYSQAFGCAVAIDGNTIVVGSYWDHRVDTGAGSAYVFVKPAAGWTSVTQVAKLTASDGGFHDRFGWSVDISGSTIVIGAPGVDSSGISNHGSAYVFVRPSGGWTDMTETAILNASDRQIGDELGRRVAVDGDTVVVGAPFASVGLNAGQGAAYVFTPSASGWGGTIDQAKLTASDGAAGDYFGSAVAVSGDTVIAGAYARADGDQVGVGQVYVFTQSGAWADDTENARLTASDKAHHEYFGLAVAVQDSVVLVGAPGEMTFDGNGQESVYVFADPPGGWNGDLTETAVLAASDGTAWDGFGSSVDISGDLVVVGAPYAEIAGETNQGAAYVFARPPGGWEDAVEAAKLSASDGTDSDEFGMETSISSGTIVVGAERDDIVQVGDNTGSAYLYGQEELPQHDMYLPQIGR